MAAVVNVDVPDLERGIAFYTAAFELQLSRRLGSDFAELLGAGIPIYLIVANTGTPPFRGATHVRDYARHWTPVHFDFVVEDLDRRCPVRSLRARSRRVSRASTPTGGSCC